MTRYIINPDVGKRLVIGRLKANPYGQKMRHLSYLYAKEVKNNRET
jgi:hypothetical protein